MLTSNMNESNIKELLNNDINGFLNGINSILEETEKERKIKNISEEIDTESGCLFEYFSIKYSKLSDILNKYNIFWIALLKRFCYCSLTVNEQKEKTETKENNNLLEKGKAYNNIKQYSLRFDSELKSKLDNTYNDYPYLDKTYINSRIIELGLKNI